MQFYTRQHKFYYGIDLHARKMYICILDEEGEVREHRNIRENGGTPPIFFLRRRN
jgi:predicted NBD/HSP70 family sugar kinase